MKYKEVTFHITAPEGAFDDACDLVAAAAGEAGFETFEYTDEGLKGYVQTQLFSPSTLDDALADFPIENVKISYDAKDADNRDWNEQWEQQGFDPIYVGTQCAIHDGRHLPEQGKCDIEIEIDTKLAFGTGNHETTRMMVERLMNLDLKGKTVLDAGCGTGILGIAALKRGASSVVGYDIDEWSSDNARHNAVINRVDDRYEALLGDGSILDTINQTFDVVVANINRNILLADFPRFVNVLRDGGTLLLSGFYTDDEETLKSHAATHGLTFVAETHDNRWACLEFSA